MSADADTDLPAGLPAAEPLASLLAGAGADSALAARLLAARESGGMAALFADHPDPTVRAVAELMARRQQEEREEREAEEAAPVAEPPPTPEPLALRRRLRALEAEVERLLEINDGLAAALGACPRCWGEDAACPDCEGEGGPGAVAPERELFHRLVMPAVRRIKHSLMPPPSRPRPTSPRRSEPNPREERRRE